MLINGVSATTVSGTGSGLCRFQFAAPAAGRVRFSWAANHGIHDLASPANTFAGEEWWVEVNPEFVVSPVRLNEFLASNIAATGLTDEDSKLQDWIEIYISGASAMNLDG